MLDCINLSFIRMQQPIVWEYINKKQHHIHSRGTPKFIDSQPDRTNARVHDICTKT